VKLLVIVSIKVPDAVGLRLRSKTYALFSLKLFAEVASMTVQD